MQFRKFTSIEKYANVVHNALKYKSGKVLYKSKVKLHGTNASVTISKNKQVRAGKRSSFIGDGHYGFYDMVQRNIEIFKDIADRYRKEFSWVEDIVIYGEWAGKGVQKVDAVCSFNKAFYIFTVVLVDADGELYYTYGSDVDEELLTNNSNEIKFIPFEEDSPIEVNFADTASIQSLAAYATQMINEIDKCDPLIYNIYDGFVGSGEGLVFYPFQDKIGLISHKFFTSYVFKAKTERHLNNGRSKKRSKVEELPENIEDIMSFVKKYVTDARCEQMIFDNNIDVADIKQTGLFLKALGQDIKKESVLDLESNNMTFKEVGKYCNQKAKAWLDKKREEVLKLEIENAGN